MPYSSTPSQTGKQREIKQRDPTHIPEHKEVMYIKRIAAAVAAVFVATALAMGLTPQPAEAAASVSIAGVAKTNAVDIKSKGTIKTPTVKTSGNVAVSSRSYVITKGKKTVAKTSSQGKAYKLGLGTYKVKTTAKYRTVTTKYRTDFTNDWVSSDETYIDWSAIAECKVVGEAGYETTQEYWYTSPTVECNVNNKSARYRGQVYAADRTGQTTLFDFQTDFPAGQMISAKTWSTYFTGDTDGVHGQTMEVQVSEVWGKVPTQVPYKVYGPLKSTTRTQLVKISNSGTMTNYEYRKIKHKAKLSKVKSVVGGTGTVVDRYSAHGDDYVTREYNGHCLYFRNGKVWAKQW